MPNFQADRNLLFGILALQMDFISRDALAKAMQAWVLEKSKPLGQILAEQGALTGDRRDFVEAMIQKHVEVHGNDIGKSLAAVSSAGSVRADLQQIADADLDASLALVSQQPTTDDLAATVGYARVSNAVGTPTSSGLRFRILRQHAKGGLGQVYVAHDEELQREVALKEIQSHHADNKESRARFLLEAEITGGLEHPGIVPVYGLGQYADGRPFYAMRFIRGDSLQSAIKEFHKAEVAGREPGERTLELRKLLGRFIDVCQAIQYAHDRGVLHRDLKPGNIMLGKYGETLVVDWGLAKAAGKFGEPGASAAGDEPTLMPASGGESSETQPGHAIGTPAYMSPEQAAGRHDLLGPASDVYSLGATLYSLLTGKTAVEGKDIAVVLKKVQTGDLIAPRQRKPSVDPALEAVCLKAMALKPADRYASPQGLANDIEHWLADEPVSARAEPLTVRARRWTRQHRTLVTSAAAVLLVATIGSIVASALLANVNGQLEARNLALDTANGRLDVANTSLKGTNERLDVANANLKTTNNDLDGANRNLKTTNVQLGLARKDADNKRQQAEDEKQIAQAVRTFLQYDLLLQADPTHQANRLLMLGSADFKTAENPTIKELLDRAAAELTSKKIERKFPKQPLVQAAILQTVGRTYLGVGDFTKAVAHLERARSLYEANLGPDHLDTITSMGNLALGYEYAGKVDLALLLYEDTLKLRKAKLGPDHPDTLTSMSNLAFGYQTVGKLNLALPLYEETLKLRKAKVGSDHPDTLTSMNNLAGGYQAAGKLDLALPLLEETLLRMKAKLGSDHPNALTCMNNLAAGYLAAGKLELALPLFAETLKLSKAKFGPDHPATLTCMSRLAGGYLAAGKRDLALPLFEQTLKLRKANLGRDHPDTLTSMNNLAEGWREVGRLDLALPLLDETLKLRKDKLGPDHPDTLTTMGNLAESYRAAGKLDLAVRLFKETLKLQKAKLGSDHPNTLITMNNLAEGYRAAGNLDLALPLHEETLKLMKAKLGPDHPHTLNTMNNLAEGYRGAGKLDLAVPLHEETLKLMKAKLGPDHPNTLVSMSNLALAYLAARLPEQALPLVGEFVAGQRKRLGANDLRFGNVLASVSLELLKARQFPEAEKLLRECLPLRAKREPDAWTTFGTQSMLGGALLGQKKYADAEPILLAACLGLQEHEATIPANAKFHLTEAEGRLAEVFEATRKKDETNLQGKLTDAKTAAVHEVKLTAGPPAVIEMQSAEFDTLLRLQDAKGKTLAENDDIDFPGNNLNSRILFIPKADGVYRIIAASFQQTGRGAYQIIIRQYSPAKSK